MDTKIVGDYLPDALGRITELHANFYHRHAGFGLHFESKVACELAEFLGRHDEKRDHLWLAMANGQVEGSIIIDGQFGALVVINLVIGLLTPPVGMLLFVVANIGKIPLAELSRGIVPFLLWSLAVLAMLVYFPALTTWLPGHLG